MKRSLAKSVCTKVPSKFKKLTFSYKMIFIFLQFSLVSASILHVCATMSDIYGDLLKCVKFSIHFLKRNALKFLRHVVFISQLWTFRKIALINKSLRHPH